MSAFEAFLQTHPVFTTEDFEGFQRSRGSRSRSTRRTILARQEEKGRILRVRRGLYVAIPYGESPDEIRRKIQRLDDTLVWRYFELLTDCSMIQINAFQSDLESGKRTMIEIKDVLADDLLDTCHG